MVTKRLVQVKGKLPVSVKTIFSKFTQANFEIYLVGGGIRSWLTNQKISNCDFTTNAKPEEIQKLFPDSFYDNAFGTVGIRFDKEIYEITTYRTERGYADRRHPDQIQWGQTLTEDLQRRDFTINAMAIGPNQKGQLEFIDLFAGEEDLKNKIIRCVGQPEERFNEDALRLMRAVRLATQLGFVIEEKTFQAIKKNSQNLAYVSAERIRDELFKILASPYPADGIVLLYNADLLSKIMPELVKARGVDQAGHHRDDVFNHSLKSLQNCKNPNPIIRLATLLHDIGKPVVAKKRRDKITFYNHELVGASVAQHLAHRLKFSKKDREKLVLLIRWHMFTVDEKITDSAVRRFIRRIGQENIQEMMDLRIADRLGGGCLSETSWRLRLLQKRILDVQKHLPSVSDLKVSGHDVMKILKIPAGPKVGQVLNQLFEEILDNPLKNKRRHLLQRLQQISASAFPKPPKEEQQ